MFSFEIIDMVVVLIACRDRNGLYRFPSNNPEILGLLLKRDRIKGMRFEDYVDFVLSGITGKPEAKHNLTYDCIVHSELRFDTECVAPLLLAHIDVEDFVAPSNWPTLSEYLKKTQKNRNRIAYMKVLQLLSGGAYDDVDAIEIDDALLKKIWEN